MAEDAYHGKTDQGDGAKRGRARFYITTREDSSSFFEPERVQNDGGIEVRETIEVETELLDAVIDGARLACRAVNWRC